MNSKEVKISAFQLGVLIIVTTIGVGILTLPRNVVEIADTDGWILIITAGAIIIGISLMINTLANKFPNETIIEFSRDLGGYPLSILIGIILFLYFIVLAAFSVRIFGEVLKMFLLPNTPIEIIIITFLITITYLIRSDFEGIVRFYQIIILIMFIPYFIALFTGTANLEYSNVLPAFQTSPMDILTGTIQVIFSFIGFEAAFLFLPFVSDKENMKKTLIIVISIITFIYLISTLIVLASFGSHAIQTLMWPLMSYIKSIQVPGAFIEQLEGVIMTVWVLFIFTTLGTMNFSSAFVLAGLIKTKEHKIFATALLPIIYILSLQPDNVAQIYDWLGVYSMYAGTIVVIIIPVFLLILAKIRKKGVKSNG